MGKALYIQNKILYICLNKTIMDKQTEEFYKRLKEELDKDTVWPSEYLFKFIVPSDQSKIAQIERAFDGKKALIETRDSSTGKFTSVSIRVMMEGSQAIVDKYIQMSEIEGIVSL